VRPGLPDAQVGPESRKCRIPYFVLSLCGSRPEALQSRGFPCFTVSAYIDKAIMSPWDGVGERDSVRRSVLRPKPRTGQAWLLTVY
jgi:hypothetical protein